MPVDFSFIAEEGVAIVLGSILYGIFILQVYIYAFRFKGDSLVVRLFVLWTFLLDSLHQALLIRSLWFFLINFDEPAMIIIIDWSSQAVVPIAYAMSFSVQLFYTYRIRELTSNNVICGLISLFSLLYVSFGIYFETGVAKSQAWFMLYQQSTFLWALEASLGCSIIADAAIAASLGLTLRRKLAEFDQMRSVMHKLISYAIGTGFLLVVISVITLVALGAPTLAGLPSFDILFMLLPKLYTNSVMISLNARKAMRKDLSQTTHMVGHIPSDSIRLSGIRNTDHHTCNQKLSAAALESGETF